MVLSVSGQRQYSRMADGPVELPEDWTPAEVGRQVKAGQGHALLACSCLQYLLYSVQFQLALELSLGRSADRSRL